MSVIVDIGDTKVKLFKNHYEDNGSLYIGAFEVDDDEDNASFDNYYGDVTINTYACNGNFVTLDNNNSPMLTEEVLKHSEWYVGSPVLVPQGFCSYPAVAFKPEFVDLIDNFEE